MQKKTSLSIIVLLFMFVKLHAQTATVHGVIRDSLNKPVESVSVAVVGTSGGVISDKAGYYELTVPAAKEITLAFSFIGYRTERKKVELTILENRILLYFLKNDNKNFPKEREKYNLK